MKTIDATKKHAVTLTFLLDEEVTPQLFAQKIALACAGGGALRPGEAVLIDHAKSACVVVEEGRVLPSFVAEMLAQPSFGYEWRRSLKEPKRKKLTPNRCK